MTWRKPKRGWLSASQAVVLTWVAVLAACTTLSALAPRVTLHLIHKCCGSSSYSSGGIYLLGVGEPSFFVRRQHSHLWAGEAGLHEAAGTQCIKQQLQHTMQHAAIVMDGGQEAVSANTVHRQQHQQQEAHQVVMQNLKLGAVDVVYLWVNGSDPQLQQDLQDLQHNATGRPAPDPGGNVQQQASPEPLLDDPVKQARFDIARDELRFSLRSLEAYMPWYRHLHIVTNGQVPSWLDLHNPRVTVVPHSSIFKRPEDLPTFNSNAILANVHNIPGLSDNFIVFDDDLFLTAPWELADFVQPRGGHVLTGTAPAGGSQGHAGANLHLQMTRHTADVFQQHFGQWPRFIPEHSPKFFQRRWLSELQHKIPGALKQTSASHTRNPNDIVISAAYQWYVSQFEPGVHPSAPDTRTSFLSVNDLAARPFLDAAVRDFDDAVEAGDALARATKARQRAGNLVLDDQLKAAAFAVARSAQGVVGPNLARCMRTKLLELINAWTQAGSKMVCLNDDLPDYLLGARLLIDPTIQGFLAARYRTPSVYELPPGDSNGCKKRLPQMAFGQLPAPADYAAACDNAVVASSGATASAGLVDSHTNLRHTVRAPQGPRVAPAQQPTAPRIVMS